MWTNSIKNDNLKLSVNIETNKIYFSLNTEPASKVFRINKNNLSQTITEFQISNNYENIYNITFSLNNNYDRSNNKEIKWIITIKTYIIIIKFLKVNNCNANNKMNEKENYRIDENIIMWKDNFLNKQNINDTW